MHAPLYRFVAAQSPEEIARQARVLGNVEITRTCLTIFAYLVMAIYLPLSLCLILAALDTAVEWLGARALQDLEPARQPWRYLAAHGAVVVAELAFTLPAALLWQLDDTFARALSIGVIAVTLLQLMSVRCIHLPFALTGWSTVLSISLVGNAAVWLRLGDMGGLALSTLITLATALFALRILMANHDIHDEIARERAAAQAADQAKSLFLAQMSHELRTPLNAIIGMGFIELTMSRAPDTRSRMATLVQSARGLGTILDDILDLAAAREGRLTLRPADLDLAEEVRLTVALFRPLAEAQGIRIELALPEDLPALARFDGQRMRQCLSNILSNALKHTTQGTITVRVQAAPGLAAITVSDTGPGIAPAVAAHLFEPFLQGPGAARGTGLGLAISRQIARAMGGDLVLMPQTHGARFRLTFHLQPMDAPLSQMPADAAQTARPAVLDGARVLVVDDIATNRLVAASYLRLLNARPVEAANAEEALALIAAETPAAVLLDMNMPGTNGIETFRLICLDAARRGIARPPVVAMTADATETHRQAYLAAGLDGYVAKPLDLAILQTSLEAVLPRPA